MAGNGGMRFLLFFLSVSWLQSFAQTVEERAIPETKAQEKILQERFGYPASALAGHSRRRPRHELSL